MPKSKREQIWDMMRRNRDLAKRVLGKDSIMARIREPRGISMGSPYELDEGNGEDALKLEMKEGGYKP